jgi:hypothetical protein
MKQNALPELIPAFPGVDGGQQGHWGNQNDQVTWKDGRFASSDLGSVFSCVFKGAGMTIPKAVCCVRFDDKAAVFDPATFSFPVQWTGGFIKLNDARHGFMGGGPMDGKVIPKDDRLKIEKGHRVSRTSIVTESGSFSWGKAKWQTPTTSILTDLHPSQKLL